MTTLKPYPAYQEVDSPWFESVPAHWALRRLSTLLERNDSGAWGSDHSDDGTKVLRSTEQTQGGGWRIENPAVRGLSPAENAKTLLKAGDLVVTTSSGSQKHIGKTSIVTEAMEAEEYGFSNFMQRLRTGPTLLPKLVWYLINNQVGREQLVYSSTTTTGLANLNGTILGSIIVPLPLLDEQRAIADFLDAMDARITRFIAARKKMIRLLEEKKQAAINQAVTKGLDPTVPMKDSGIDWLGDIPAHWDVRKVGAVTGLIQTGPFGSQLPASEYVEGGVSLINPSHIVASHIVPDANIAVAEPTANRLGRHRFLPNDIVMARRGEMGRCAVVRDYETGWLCGTGSLLIRPKPELVDSAYLQLVLSNRGLAAWLELTSAGATMSNLNTTMVASIQAPNPPIPEQRRIIAFVTTQSEKADALVGRAEREIELMQEYRTRLIIDVVTGKLDVCDIDLGELPELEEIPESDETSEFILDEMEIEEVFGSNSNGDENA